MSITATRRRLKTALADAEAFRALVGKDTCERWEFAGSLRRQQAMVGDIDHVVIPRWGEVPTEGLFAEPRTANLLWERLDRLVKEGKLTKAIKSNGMRWGEKHRSVVFNGFDHELYTADVENWWPVMAIKTGPAELSKRFVIDIQKSGHCHRGGFYVCSKRRWYCVCGWKDAAPEWVPNAPPKREGIIRAPDRPDEQIALCPMCRRTEGLELERIAIPDEQAYFRVCGLRWVPPEKRG